MSPTTSPSTGTLAERTRWITARIVQGCRHVRRLLITVAPTGAETAKADCPQLPTTPEEIARTAAECEAAGAAMIHLHVRDA